MLNLLLMITGCFLSFIIGFIFGMKFIIKELPSEEEIYHLLAKHFGENDYSIEVNTNIAKIIFKRIKGGKCLIEMEK